MNLHHFLYQQALAQKAGREGRAIRGAGEVVSVEALNDYAYKQGVFREYRQLMEKHWQPYLDGKSDFAEAIKQMVAGL